MRTTPLGATEGVCDACGARVWLIQFAAGAIALNPAAPTYQLEILNDASDPPRFRWVAANTETTIERACVAHVATCSAAGRSARRTS